MSLTPMRYKTFVWPHNPRIYEIKFQRHMCSHKVPFGRYVLQNLGQNCRILRGEGEFCGPGAYDKLKELGVLYYQNTPGLLVHPVWQCSNAYLVGLSLLQEPREDYVRYTIEFWETYDAYEPGMTLIHEPEQEQPAAQEESWYTVVYGDCLWNIAVSNGMTLSELLALNPQIKNPNILYPGDLVRVR